MSKKKIIVIICIVLGVICIGVGGYYAYNYYTYKVVGKSKYLKLKLIGKNEETIDVNSEYTDNGAKATYQDKDISKELKIDGKVDTTKVGEYVIKYSIKYLKQEKEIERKVLVVDSVKPTISLKGKSEIVMYVNDTYNEDGVEVSDNYDTDLSEKVEIINTIDNKKAGEYTITYNVTDSSGNSNSIIRKIRVMDRPVVASSGGSGGVAVLNYHFFYKNPGECNETICFSIDKFEEQIKYLKENNIKVLTMDEFVNWIYGNLEIDGKAVLLTVDDGAYGTGAHNGNYLIPVLEKYQVQATLFLITGWWDISNYRSPYLNVESHTHDLHIRENCGYASKVNCVGYDRLVSDLRESIAVTNSTRAFCFPFYEATNTSIQAVKDVGFKVAFLGGGVKASRNSDKFRIPRYVIYYNTSLEQFKRMVN